MGYIIRNTGGEYIRELPPAGNQLAICYGFVDMGTKLDNFGNMSHKIRLTWELCNEFRVNKEGEKIPFSVSKEYTASLNEKATLRQHLESWRGKGFTDKELEGFEMKNLIGVPCLLNIIHKESKTGNKYAVVTSITPVMKGLEIPPMFHNPIFLSFQEKPYNMEVYKKLPEYLQELISESKEWKSINGNAENSDSSKIEIPKNPTRENLETTQTDEKMPELSIEELQTEIKKLIGFKYDAKHQPIAVKQWLESMSIQGCSDRKKLEKFLARLNELEDIEYVEEEIPF